MSMVRLITLFPLFVFVITGPLPAAAKEFKVDCTSVEDCMTKGDKLTKKRKLSLALEAYRKAFALYPQMDGLKEQVDGLARKLDGRDI